MAQAARFRIPAIYPSVAFVQAGGLASYGVELPDLFRRAASYVDRILKGEKPADLPVQAPTKYQLVINLNTAKALGLSVPPTLLAHRRRGHRVIGCCLLQHLLHAPVIGTKRRKPRRRVYVSFWGSSGSAWTDGLGCFRR